MRKPRIGGRERGAWPRYRGRSWLGAATMVSSLALLAPLAPASALTLQEAVSLTVETNPEIGEARANRTAIDHELEQARGLYLPQIDFEGRVGPEWVDNPQSLTPQENREWHIRRELSLTLQQTLFNGFANDAEVERQASRVDAAAYRVMERSEFIGLDAIEAFLDTIRQIELVGLARDNVTLHQTFVNTINTDFQAGRASIADVQTAQERLAASQRDLLDIETQFEQARVRFERIVGQPPDQLVMPAPVTAGLPADVDTAVQIALQNNPTVQLTLADIDTAQAEYKAARANFFPTINLEAGASTGWDVEGQEGRNTRFGADLVARYNLFRGGIDSANVQEQVARIGEARERLDRFEREAAGLVRETWTTLQSAQRTLPSLEQQVAAAEQLVQSFRAQFTIGQRTLLDVLDAENELFTARIDLTTLRYAELFARYRLLASMGILLETLGIAPPQEARAAARFGAGMDAPDERSPGGQPVIRDSSPTNTWVTNRFRRDIR